jgi:hypothetical protein
MSNLPADISTLTWDGAGDLLLQDARFSVDPVPDPEHDLEADNGRNDLAA